MLFWGFLTQPLRPQKPEEKLQYDVSVTLKLIQVFVLDEDKNPVLGLAKSDFLIYDNGQLQSITEFERHELLPEIAGNELWVETEPESSRQVPLLNRKFFFLFDFTRMNVDGLKQARDAALDFLDTKIQAQDEVGVLTFSELKGMQIHQYLTLDHAQARTTLESFVDVVGRPIWAFTLWGEQDRAMQELGQQRGRVFSDYNTESGIRSMVIEKNPEMYAVLLKNFEFIDQMEEVAKSVRTIPGSKNIILFSGGFQGHYQADPFFSRRFDNMTREFAASNSPVHTINTEGTRQFLKDRAQRGDGELKNISSRSGGKYFLDVKDYSTINQDIQAITANYYVLGYYVDAPSDGKYHEIKVKLNSENYEVIAQSGYFNPKPFKKFSKFEKQLHLIDLAMSEKPQSQDPVRFPLAALICGEPGSENLALMGELQGEKLQVILGESTESVILIFDEFNFQVETRQGSPDFLRTKEGLVYVYSLFSLPPGEYECRLIVRDLDTGQGAVGAARVSVPEALESGIRIYPPLVLVSGIQGRLDRFSSDKENTKFLDDVYPQIPTDLLPLVCSLDNKVSYLAAVLPVQRKNTKENNLVFEGILRQESSGNIFPLKLNIRESETRGAWEYSFMEWGLPVLESGKYILEIRIDEKDSQPQFSVSRSFVLK